MPGVEDAAAVRSERTLERCPNRLRDAAPSAHASEEFDERIARLEALRTSELEHMLDVAEDLDRMLDLKARRLWILVAPVLIRRVDVFDQADTGGRGELEKVPQMDDDGMRPKW